MRTPCGRATALALGPAGCTPARSWHPRARRRIRHHATSARAPWSNRRGGQLAPPRSQPCCALPDPLLACSPVRDRARRRRRTDDRHRRRGPLDRWAATLKPPETRPPPTPATTQTRSPARPMADNNTFHHSQTLGGPGCPDFQLRKTLSPGAEIHAAIAAEIDARFHAGVYRTDDGLTCRQRRAQPSRPSPLAGRNPSRPSTASPDRPCRSTSTPALRQDPHHRRRFDAATRRCVRSRSRHAHPPEPRPRRLLRCRRQRQQRHAARITKLAPSTARAIETHRDHRPPRDATPTAGARFLRKARTAAAPSPAAAPCRVVRSPPPLAARSANGPHLDRQPDAALQLTTTSSTRAAGTLWRDQTDGTAPPPRARCDCPSCRPPRPAVDYPGGTSP